MSLRIVVLVFATSSIRCGYKKRRGRKRVTLASRGMVKQPTVDAEAD